MGAAEHPLRGILLAEISYQQLVEVLRPLQCDRLFLICNLALRDTKLALFLRCQPVFFITYTYERLTGGCLYNLVWTVENSYCYDEILRVVADFNWNQFKFISGIMTIVLSGEFNSVNFITTKAFASGNCTVFLHA